MTPIALLMRGVDVRPMQDALKAHPELWDRNQERTSPEDSPHCGLSDIWVRYADQATMKEDGSHDSIWYPPADVLPVKELVFPLMQAVQGTRLGGILITRIKPGQICRPHTDPGWHARYYDKFAIQIEASEGQAFHFRGHSLATMPGDLFWFDNSHEHWVTNDSQSDRITMIACIRVERN